MFDCSAKSSQDNVSVNDCLHKGPNIVPHLFDMVVNFQGYPIGLVAGVVKAFHQIQIAAEERRMLKFLWFEDISQEPPPPLPQSRDTNFDAFHSPDPNVVSQ